MFEKPKRILLLIMIVFLSGCMTSNNREDHTSRLQVYTTLYPLEYFAKRIGEDQVQVKNLVPIGMDSHEFEPSARDLTQLSKADVLIYNGATFEPWTERMESILDEERTQMINATQSIPLLSSHEEDSNDHQHHTVNPHVWIDPQLAKKQAEQIKNGFVQFDPSHQPLYEENYRKLAAELDQLDQEFQQAIQHKKTDKIVVSHDAFAYLAKRYGLKTIAISGLSPMDEPSPQKLKQIVDTIKKYQLKYIFFETLGNERLVKTVQIETGVKVLSLHSLEGLTKKEVESGEDYFSIMRKNKAHLQKALENR